MFCDMFWDNRLHTGTGTETCLGKMRLASTHRTATCLDIFRLRKGCIPWNFPRNSPILPVHLADLQAIFDVEKYPVYFTSITMTFYLTYILIFFLAHYLAYLLSCILSGILAEATDGLGPALFREILHGFWYGTRHRRIAICNVLSSVTTWVLLCDVVSEGGREGVACVCVFSVFSVFALLGQVFVKSRDRHVKKQKYGEQSATSILEACSDGSCL